MCGIFALYAPHASLETRVSLTKKLTQTIKHRGPDHQGEWFDPEVPVSLAQRRLAIVDLTPDGRQPMESHSGRYMITFNGEIYNFPELRDALEEKGVRFKGRSDTEILLAAIDTWGLNTTCQKINGMYAIVLWDRHEHALHFLRDPMGKKPLYIGWAGNHLVAASELKPFLAHPQFDRTCVPDAVALYMRLGYIPAPHCIFKNVMMMPPGSRLMIRPEKVVPGQDLRGAIEPFWSPSTIVTDAFTKRAVQERKTPAERLAETERLIEQCVTDRMIADVPLGAFLSGGIDSSLVCALAQKNSSRSIDTFSIGFDERGYDESVFARGVAHHLGTNHHEQMITARDAINFIPDLPAVCDEPLADISILPTYFLSKFTREKVTVALSGDGGDEFFGGYERHTRIQKLLTLMNNMPLGMRAGMQSILSAALPIFAGVIAPGNPHFKTRLAKMTASLTLDNLPDMYEFLAGMAEDTPLLKNLCRPGGYPFRNSTSWPTGLSAPEWMMFADTIHYLPNDVLTKVDRASMASALEVRAPLLDKRLFAHAWSLPMEDKISNGQGKYMLRRILRRYVPNELVDRPKQGFAVPIGEWMCGPLKSWSGDMISRSGLEDVFGLDAVSVRSIYNEHVSGKRSAPQTLWRVCVLAAWADRWLVK